MKSYPSIETVYVRDKETNLLRFGEIRNPELSCVSSWTVSEKIDGTNVRVIYTLGGVEVKGRTDKAQLPPGLYDAVLSKFPPHEFIVRYFTEYRGQELPEAWSVTFYGEGYGAGIQKGGCYRPDKSFRCFDLLLGESWWTDDSEMRRVCLELGVPTVPAVGQAMGHTISFINEPEDILRLFPDGVSVCAREDSGQDAPPEGIVCKPKHVLLDRHGNRIVWKITLREWKDK